MRERLRQILQGWCHDGGYDSCDSLALARTLYSSGGVPTFAITSDFAYNEDLMNIEYTQASAWSTKWNNQLSIPQSQSFSHTIAKQTSQSWSTTEASKISSSITVKETAGVPAVVQEEMSATISTEISVSDTSTTSTT